MMCVAAVAYAPSYGKDMNGVVMYGVAILVATVCYVKSGRQTTDLSKFANK